MNTLLRKASLVLAVLLWIPCTACSQKQEQDEAADSKRSYADITLGTDFTDLNTRLTVLTNRIDLIADDPNVQDFQDYKRAFNELYPGIDVIIEGFPDYDFDMTTRLESTDWDICLIPAQMATSELPKYFEPFDTYSALADKYEFIEIDAYDGQVYGVPSSYNTSGVIYNKKVWADAGIKEIPKTPDEFIAALKQIKEKTDATPLYTNYAAGWTLNAWDYYDAGVTGDGRYRYYVMPYEENPFAKREDGSGIYEMYSILYRAANEGLIEDDPSATNWELCKASINNGKIGCMMLGSWAVPQMQSAGSHPEDIGYMPFPVTVNGKQYATSGANFSYGINKKVTDDKKLASKIFVKFMTEQSGYAYDQGGVSIVKDDPYTNTYDDFADVELVREEKAGDGEEDVFAKVNEASGMGLDATPDHVIELIDAAIDGSKSFDEIMDEWNAAWTEAQKQVLPAN